MVHAMAKTTVIAGGTIVTDTGEYRADLVINGDRISGIVADGNDIPYADRIDATGLLVMPGAIDPHTHFREPDEFTQEGFTSGSLGAAAGGVTTVIEMPQADPTTISASQLHIKIAQVGRNAIVDIALWGGIVGEPLQDPDEIPAMAEAGAVAFKSFMASTSPSFPAVNDDQLLHSMRVAAATGLPYGLHAESDVLVRAGIARMRKEGRTDPLAHPDSVPPIVETAAVNTALLFARETGCWVHICHCASAEALGLIAEARARGIMVTVETCPQYLTLNTTDLIARKGFARCEPALRDQEEVDRIWPFVLDETIDYICSDHVAYSHEQKAAGEKSIFNAPNGISGIQTLVPVFYDAAVIRRGMSRPQFVRMTSTNAAQMFGLYPRKGSLAVGADADVMLLDPNESWIVRAEDLRHRQQWSPWEGKEITGRVRRTIRRGETIYDEMSPGQPMMMAKPGSGKFLARGYGAQVGE
jgi:allantoinase